MGNGWELDLSEKPLGHYLPSATRKKAGDILRKKYLEKGKIRIPYPYVHFWIKIFAVAKIQKPHQKTVADP